MSSEIHKIRKLKLCSMNNSIITLLIVIGFVQTSASANAQEIAIVKNFNDSEIDSLQLYLNSMGFNSKTLTNEDLAYDSVANCDLLIWDDLSYQFWGVTDSNVSVYNKFYQSGKPLYFIGDDLAYSIINLSPDWAPVWTSLLHLSGVNNFSQSYNVVIADTANPITDGDYGHVNNFDYNLDIDLATGTNTGEIVLANTIDSDVLLAFEGTMARTVTQNCLVVQAGSDASIYERKKIFRNAVAWLLGFDVSSVPLYRNLRNIAVDEGMTRCYNATKTIQVAGNGYSFIVNNGGRATMIAGQKINYNSGTMVQNGGYMLGRIAPTGPFCATPSMPEVITSHEVPSTGIEKSSFKIFPNPTTGNFILELNGDAPVDKVTVDFYGMWGEKILSKILNGEGKHEFSLSDRPSGVYFIRVITDDKSETIKIIKQ